MQFIEFKINKNYYAIPLTDIKNVINFPDIDKVPGMSQFMDGVFNHRGDIITMLNSSKILREDFSPRRALLVYDEENVLALGIGEQTTTINIEDEQIEDLKGSEFKLQDSVITKIGKLEDRLILILDSKKILNILTEEKK